MTEQSKIPLPEGEKSGKSLFERAEGAFGLDGFAAAPVPSQLAEPANRRVPRKVVTTEPMPSPIAGEGGAPSGAEGEGSAAPAAAFAGDRSPNPLPQGERVENRQPIAFTSAPQKIDRGRLQELGMIVPGAAVSTLFEEFRIVKRQVLLSVREARSMGDAAAAQRVLVSSPLPGEGKTFCATNLALALAAEKDSEVVLVDADFAKPTVLALLGLSGGKGLMDALADPAIRIEDCVIPTDIHGLYVLPAGNRTSADSEFLASGRTSEVLGRLTQGAPNRIVIFDSPPALAASPAAELGHHVGQALVICRADQTGQSALEDALSLLAACPDIKLLLNSAHFSPSGRRFGTYYG
jgi:Mrp family chromosome partitioning ATPase